MDTEPDREGLHGLSGSPGSPASPPSPLQPDHVHAHEGEEPEHDGSGVWLPATLFGVTVFTTLWAGAYHTNTEVFVGAWEFIRRDPSVLLKGIPFALTLLGILVTHELGHYVLSRIHRVPASFPLFIPGPPHFIGTFGAIIRMRGPILSRKALFDIGVAGPLAGFVVAVVALIIGLSRAEVVPAEQPYGLQLGEPLLLQFFAWLVVGPIPAGKDIALDAVGFAAWFGLFITFLNLIPIGQLDGGHVAYALWGEQQHRIAIGMVPVLLLLGMVGWPGWFVWAGLAGFIGLAHPPVQDPQVALGRTRVWVGWIALAIFVLTFSPIPFAIR